MVKLIEFMVKEIKKDPNYKFRSDISSRELVEVVKYRAFQIIRGIVKRFKFKKLQGLCFLGRKVIIEHGYKISAGNGLIIEDFVVLNAFSELGISFGRNVTIAKSSILQCTGVLANKGKGIKIGNNSAVGAQSYLGGQGGIEIGNDVIMGPGVMIFSENHNYESPYVEIRKQGENRKGVKINNNCWIGAGCKILDGVSIGEGSVIAAGSVVTKNIPSNSIAAGVPAKIVKSRIPNELSVLV